MLALLLVLVTQTPVLQESFTNGQKTLNWVSYFHQIDTTLTPEDSMVVVQDSTTPEGDGWAGLVLQAGGSPSGIAYAEDHIFSDSLTVEAWIYTQVTPAMGPYNGLVFFVDPVTGGYYSLIADFDSDGRIRVAHHDTSFMPTVIHVWTASNGDFQLPSASSWHRFKLVYQNNQIWVYFDGNLLPGCPIQDNTGSITVGYIGFYTFIFSGEASTKVDGIVAYDSPLVGVNENFTFNEKPSISYRSGHLKILGLNEGLHTLKVFDITGRRVLNRVFRGERLSLPVNLKSGVYVIRLDEHSDRIAVIR